MIEVVRHPLLVFVLSLAIFLLSTWVGVLFFRRQRKLNDRLRDDYNIILGATLTFLGLIIGFSFAMAISRYDQRKNYEEAEANAISTEYVRADLLPASDAAQLHTLLQAYLEQRILFYVTRDANELRKIGAQTARLQAELWSTVKVPALAQPTPVAALAVTGMNDVLSSQGYTQAAWWNRIPIAAWTLMATIAVFGNILVGYGTREFRSEWLMLSVVPFVMSISFFLISDIDEPRDGVIRVMPQNLTSLAASLRAQPAGP